MNLEHKDQRYMALKWANELTDDIARPHAPTEHVKRQVSQKHYQHDCMTSKAVWFP